MGTVKVELGHTDFPIHPSQGECKIYAATMGDRAYLSNEVGKLMEIVRVSKLRNKLPF